jgi:hypothetical protein
MQVTETSTKSGNEPAALHLSAHEKAFAFTSSAIRCVCGSERRAASADRRQADQETQAHRQNYGSSFDLFPFVSQAHLITQTGTASTLMPQRIGFVHGAWLRKDPDPRGRRGHRAPHSLSFPRILQKRLHGDPSPDP